MLRCMRPRARAPHALRVPSTCCAHELEVVAAPRERSRERLGRLLDDEAVHPVLHQLWNDADVGDHRKASTGHALDERPRVALGVRRHRDDVETIVEVGHLALRQAPVGDAHLRVRFEEDIHTLVHSVARASPPRDEPASAHAVVTELLRVEALGAQVHARLRRELDGAEPIAQTLRRDCHAGVVHEVPLCESERVHRAVARRLPSVARHLLEHSLVRRAQSTLPPEVDHEVSVPRCESVEVALMADAELEAMRQVAHERLGGEVVRPARQVRHEPHARQAHRRRPRHHSIGAHTSTRYSSASSRPTRPNRPPSSPHLRQNRSKRASFTASASTCRRTRARWT